MEPSGLLLVGIALIVVGGVLWLRRSQRERVNWIVVDGSNVLHWENDTPDIQNVVHVLKALKSEGYVPVIWFDANVGYLISNRYMDPHPLAAILGLNPRRVFVAPKGTPADPLLLAGARRLKARVVTNDKFRDWQDEYPEVREPGFLVPGRMSATEFELGWGD